MDIRHSDTQVCCFFSSLAAALVFLFLPHVLDAQEQTTALPSHSNFWHSVASGEKTVYRRKVESGLGLLASSFNAAAQDFDDAIRMSPKQADAYMGKGYLSKQSGDYDGCDSYFAKALALNPRFSPHYTNITPLSFHLDWGECKTKAKRFKEAQTIYQNIVAHLDFDSRIAHRKLGEIALLQGNTSSAIRSFVRAIGPNQLHWNYFLATAFELSGDIYAFRTAMAKALERDPQQKLLREIDFLSQSERFYVLALAAMVNNDVPKATYFFKRSTSTEREQQWQSRALKHLKKIEGRERTDATHIEVVASSQKQNVKTHLQKRIDDYKRCLIGLPDLYLDIQLEKIRSKSEPQTLTMANDHRIRIVQTETTTASATEVNTAKSCVYKQLLPDYLTLEKIGFRSAGFSVFGDSK